MGLCCLRNTRPEPVAKTVVPVAPPCLDASDDDAMEEEWLEAQMQEMFDIVHAEAAMIDESGGQNPFRVEHELSQSAYEPKLIIGRCGCIAGEHTVPHAEHIFLRRAAQHAARFWKDDGVGLSTGGLTA